MKDIDYIPQDDEMEDLRKRILAARETEQESLRHANEELMTHFIYNSINLAGERSSRIQITRILKQETDPSADLPFDKTTLAILGLRDAYNNMLDIADSPAITSEQVSELHRLYYTRIDDITAGHCRPDTEKRNYEAELNNFLEWFNGSHDADCFRSSAAAYRRYIYMHPYKGGNGHLARLILALKMFQHGYPAIVIPNKWKAEYDSLIKNLMKTPSPTS